MIEDHPLSWFAWFVDDHNGKSFVVLVEWFGVVYSEGYLLVLESGEWILVLSGWRSALAFLFNNQKRPVHGGLGDNCICVEEDPSIFVVWFGVILEEGEVAAALWVVGGGFHFHCGWSMERDEWWVMRCSLFWECAWVLLLTYLRYLPTPLLGIIILTL